MNHLSFFCPFFVAILAEPIYECGCALDSGQILEKKKANDEAIRAASAEKDPLSSFPAFRFYCRDGNTSNSRSNQHKVVARLCLLSLQFREKLMVKYMIEEK